MAGFSKSINALTAILALSCAIPFSARAQSETICEVKGVMGNVKVYSTRDRRADPGNMSSWPDARLNMPLREGDRIATLRESEVRLETPDGSTIRLRENTTVEVASLKGGADAITARIRVNDGGIVANVKRLAGGKSSFEFETPTSLAAIRGTTIELDSRSSGTTLKTFDGEVQVAPKGRSQTPNFASVKNYEMTEVAHGQASANVRAIPSFYKPKSTKLLNEYETSLLTGFTRVMLTYDELNEVKEKLESDGIAAAIGVAEATDEMTARTMSADAARAELATSMSTQVQRLSESYAQNIGGEAKRIWEESVRQITDVSVRGSNVHTTITQINREDRRFKVYSLMIIDPNRVKHQFSHTVNKMEEEFELRAKKDDMMSKMDAAIKAYDTRYHDR